jgi:hypothetical protein
MSGFSPRVTNGIGRLSLPVLDPEERQAQPALLLILQPKSPAGFQSKIQNRKSKIACFPAPIPVLRAASKSGGARNVRLLVRPGKGHGWGDFWRLSEDITAFADWFDRYLRDCRD